MDAHRFQTHILQDLRVARILAAALNAVEPGGIVSDFIRKWQPPAHQRLFLLGIGKAAEPMTFAAADSLRDFSEALVITKHASGGARERMTVMEGSHPVPDQRSLAAGKAVLDFVSGLRETDLLLCLISGGGSALVTLPYEGISLEYMQTLTTSLLASGATIDEINVVRRQLDRLKGGGLAGATQARIVSLILSDVPGDRLEAVASGPTAPNPTSLAEASAILNKYKVEPPPLEDRKPDPSTFTRVANFIIANNRTAIRAAKIQAEQEGFRVEVIKEAVSGEARLAGEDLARRLIVAERSLPRPFCLIAGGETTVTLKGNGKGGRNQELALAAVDLLAGPKDMMLISLATDGEDGPTDAAGAIVNGETRACAQALGLSAPEHLSENDAYSYFDKLGDLIQCGYTGTNVNDLMLLLAF